MGCVRQLQVVVAHDSSSCGVRTSTASSGGAWTAAPVGCVRQLQVVVAHDSSSCGVRTSTASSGGAWTAAPVGCVRQLMSSGCAWTAAPVGCVRQMRPWTATGTAYYRGKKFVTLIFVIFYRYAEL